jgi:primosomal protein N' (replication factor Y)
MVVRVVTDVAGIDKEFDYLVPPGAATAVSPGMQVRVDLHGRRVGGWVSHVGVEPAEGMPLRELAKVRGWGPEPELVDLASWAARRWASRRGAFLATASPDRAVPVLPAPSSRPPSPPGAGWAADLAGGLAPGVSVVQLAPAADPTALVGAVAQLGPVLVVVPSAARAGVLADRLARAGGDVALLPGEWARARAGAAVVLGTRAAAWGPCPGLSAAVVIDAHDEGLAQEGAPTWDAVAVVAERAKRASVPAVLVTPCPTPELLALGPVAVPEPQRQRSGWAELEVIDRRNDDPRMGLYSERLVAVLRGTDRVVCVLNRTGRARLLACAACGELARCERCGSALSQAEGKGLACAHCGLTRPEVCASCTSTVLRRLKVGVSRAREELELLSGRAVGEVTSATDDLPGADVLIGTEAVLHRLSPADGYRRAVFVDFDQELLAPRFRASAESLALLCLASRLVGGREGRVAVQTRQPDHPVIRSALLGDPSVLSDWDTAMRRSLKLPPFSAIALVSGEGAAEFVAGLAERNVELLGPHDGRWMVKAPDDESLAEALGAVRRPASRVRVAMGPARL